VTGEIRGAVPRITPLPAGRSAERDAPTRTRPLRRLVPDLHRRHPRPTRTSLLQAADVSYSYDGVVNVLLDASLTGEEGTIVGLVRPNGSGKSTLIKNIFDLVHLQSGSIRIGGRDHTRATYRQSVNLPAQLSADIEGPRAAQEACASRATRHFGTVTSPSACRIRALDRTTGKVDWLTMQQCR
jgi:ABC-type Mn2+/Zn2+ transport system ATPase subunit